MDEKNNLALLEQYNKILKQAGLKARAELWIPAAVIVSLVIAAASYFAIVLMNSMVSPLMSLIVLFVALDLSIGYPYLRARARVGKIEQLLPDALKQMADTLKAGGTYEFALREVAGSQYGPLTEEMEKVLRKLEEGENLENSLRTLSESIDSRLVERSMEIIIDSVKAGAGLSDVLDSISDDMRAMYRIQVERRAQTLMQVMFLFFAGAIVAPAIIGLVSTIVSLFIKSATGGMLGGPEVLVGAMRSRDTLMLLMQSYIFIEIAATGIMISLMREGKMTKSILYIPILLLIAYISYYASAILSLGMIGGA